MSLFSNLDIEKISRQVNELNDNIQRRFGYDPDEQHLKERGFDIIPQTAKGKCASIMVGRRLFLRFLSGRFELFGGNITGFGRTYKE